MIIRNIFIVFLFCFMVPSVLFSSSVKEKDSTVAIVGTAKIMESDLEAFTTNIPEPFKKVFKEKALKQLIESMVFSNLGARHGLDDTKEYHSKVAKAQKQILANLFIEKKLKPKVNVSEQEIDSYYRKNRAKFGSGKRIQPVHIIAKTKDLAMMVRKKVNSDNFEKVGNNLSGKESLIRFYEVGWLEQGKDTGRMPAAFENAAFALKKGEISQIVRTKMGFHIIKLNDVKPGKTVDLQKIKQKIKSKLALEKLNSLKQDFIDSAKVEIISKEYKQ